MLLLHRGEVVSTDRLVDALWGERASATAAKTVHVYVSGLRKALGDDLLVTRGHGYLLQAGPGRVDRRPLRGARGCRTAAALEAGDPCTGGRAVRCCARVVARPPRSPIWRMSPSPGAEIGRLGGAASGRARGSNRRESSRWGSTPGSPAELEGLVRENPLRERLQAQLMLALYRCGRQADALERYQQSRRIADRSARDRARTGAQRARARDPGPGPQSPSRRNAPPVRPAGPAAKRPRRGGLLIAAGGALLAFAIAAVASDPGRLQLRTRYGWRPTRGGDRPA